MPQYDTEIRFRQKPRGRDYVELLSGMIQSSDPRMELIMMQMRNDLARREGRPEEEYREEVLGEEEYGVDSKDVSGYKRIRLKKDNFYTKLQLGIRPTEDKFEIDKQFVLGHSEVNLTPEEHVLARSLIAESFKSPQQKA